MEDKQETKTRVIEVPENKELLEIDVAMGITKQIRKFESARFDVRLRRPTTMETLENDYNWAKNWVEKKLGAELASLNEAQNVNVDPFSD